MQRGVANTVAQILPTSLDGLDKSKPDKRYNFALYEEHIVGGAGVHLFVVLEDTQSKNILLFQGLATNRQTGAAQPVGMPQSDNIVAHIENGRMDELSDIPHVERLGTLYQTDDLADAGRRVVALTGATLSINAGKHPYFAGGRATLGHITAFNSNNVATTLMLAAGFRVPAGGFGGIAPGAGDPIPLSPAFANYSLAGQNGLPASAILPTLKEAGPIKWVVIREDKRGREAAGVFAPNGLTSPAEWLSDAIGIAPPSVQNILCPLPSAVSLQAKQTSRIAAPAARRPGHPTV